MSAVYVAITYWFAGVQTLSWYPFNNILGAPPLNTHTSAPPQLKYIGSRRLLRAVITQRGGACLRGPKISANLIIFGFIKSFYW